MNGNFWTRGLRVSLYAFVALLLVWGVAALNVGTDNPFKGTDPSPTPSPTTSASCDTWATAPSDYSNNRWFADGIAEIREAKNAKQARTAANTWLDKVKTDPVLLAGAAKYMLDKKVSKADLSSNDCATMEAVDLVTEIAIVLGQSRITPDDAPKDGHNSGVNDDQVVGSADSSVYGDRTAIKIVMPNGKTIWIMARCGNPVTKGSPPVPHGPTDNPPPPKPPKKCPPGQHGTPPICKDGPERQRTNADGAGKNANSGPGPYVAPKDMDRPPSTPRVNPTQPKPKPPSNPTKPKPKPEPTFTHPAPEPSAPKPDKPETGCVVIPGVEDCK